jgi:hypothetical protein
MKARYPFAVGAAVLSAVLLQSTSSAQQAPKGPPPGVPGAQVVAELKHDRSRPLREIPPTLVEVEGGREAREPLPVKHGGGKAAGFRDPVLQETLPAALMPPMVVDFDGVNNPDGVLPPDANGDVGPNHYVQWVNLSLAIYDKSGRLLYGPTSGNTLFNGFGGPCETSNDGDPIVLYDERADRWLLTQGAWPNYPNEPFYQCIAVSTTGDPTGSYNRYQFLFTKMNDSPKFGVWADGYYMAFNQFSENSDRWAGQGVAVFERDKMVAGTSARMIYVDMAKRATLGGMLPSDLDGQAPPPGTPNVFMQFDDSPDQLQLWAFHADWANPGNASFSKVGALAVAAMDPDMCGYNRNCIPQPGTTAKLDAISDRLMYRLQYRNFGRYEAWVVNHTVDVDGTDRAGVRWYEIRKSGGAYSIHQQGTYSPDSTHRWMASAAMDAAGNIAIAYNAAGPSIYPSGRYTGRLVGDPLGQMTQGEADIISGAGSQSSTSSRWGDYSMLAVDPTDGCTFWATLEYQAATGSALWRTRIAAFKFPNCGAPPPVSASPSAGTMPASPSAGTMPASPSTGTMPASPSTGTMPVFASAGTADVGAASTGTTVASSSQITLGWTDNSDNETGFKIERCTGVGCETNVANFGQIATVGAGVTSYTDTGLSPSTTYAYRVRAYNAGGDSSYSNTVSGTTAAGIAVTSLTSNVSVPATVGTAMTWTASASGGPTPLQYKFWRYSAGAWTMVQDYSTSNTYTWTSASGDVGLDGIEVWVRGAGSTAVLEVYRQAWFRVSVAIAVTSLSSNVSLPTTPGTATTWTATISRGVAPVQYQFWRRDAAGTWAMVRDWSTTATYNWTPGSSDVGQLAIEVWARNSGSTGPDATLQAWFQITTAAAATALTVVDLAPSNLAARGSGKGLVRLTWLDNSTDETYFEITRTPAFSSAVQVRADVMSYTDSSVTRGSAYAYQVRSCKPSALCSAWSNTAAVIAR